MAELTQGQKSLVEFMTKSDKHAAHGFDLIVAYKQPEDFFSELQRAGFFSAKRNPQIEAADKQGFVRIPYWSALNYLERIAKIAGEKNNVELGNKLMEVIRLVTAPETLGDEKVDNYYTYTASAEIMGSIPPSCVHLEDIELVNIWLRTKWNNDLIVKAIEDGIFRSLMMAPSAQNKEKVIRLLWICTALNEDESKSNGRDRKTVADPYWLEQLLGRYAKPLGAEIGRPAIECLLSRTKEFFDNSWVQRAAIEDHEQNYNWDYITNAFVNSTRDALDVWIDVQPAEARVFVIDLLGDASKIVRRVAINAVRQRWSLFSLDFQALISSDIFQSSVFHELYLLLNEKYAQFTDDGKISVKRSILSLSEGKEIGEELEYTQYMQRNWLNAIRGQGDREIDEEYERLVELVGPVAEHPDFLSFHTTWFGSGPSPYSVAEILSFAENQTLCNRVDGFVPNNNERRSPRKALIDAVSETVAENPEAFIPYLNFEFSMSRRLQYGILEGFNRLAEKAEDEGSRKNLAKYLDAILNYIFQVVSSESFWNEEVIENADFEPTKNWTPPVTVEIIKRVLAEDRLELSSVQYVPMLQILILVKSNSFGIEYSEDTMTAAINNTRGKAFEAILHLLLRRCRDEDGLNDGSHLGVWSEFQPILEHDMSRESRAGFEVPTLLGAYFPQLLYANESWVESNIKNIFPVADNQKFVSALTGLSYASASKKVYKALVLGDVPSRALLLGSLRESTRERMIERIALGYMWGLEELDSLLIARMFEQDQLGDLIELISTVSRWGSAELDFVQIRRAKDLVKRCVTFAIADMDKRHKLLPVAAQFINYVIPPLDEDMEWLLIAAPFALESHGSYEFIEAIDKIASIDPFKASLVLEACISIHQPNYDFREYLQSSLKKIYGAGLHLEAFRLLETLVNRGGLIQLAGLYTDLEEDNKSH